MGTYPFPADWRTPRAFEGIDQSDFHLGSGGRPYFYQEGGNNHRFKSTIHVMPSNWLIRPSKDTGCDWFCFFNIPLVKKLKTGLVGLHKRPWSGKGYELLIEAVGLLAADNNIDLLFIVGDGPLFHDGAGGLKKRNSTQDKPSQQTKSGRSVVHTWKMPLHLLYYPLPKSFGMHIAEHWLPAFMLSADCGSVHDYISKTNGTIVLSVRLIAGRCPANSDHQLFCWKCSCHPCLP